MAACIADPRFERCGKEDRRMNVTKTAIRLPFAGLVVCAALAVSEQDARAQAISAGCSELNSLAAGAVDIPIGGASTGLPTSRSLGGSASFAFNAGDSFTIQFTSTSIAAAIDVDLSLVDGGGAKFARVLDSFTAAGQVRTVTVATTADGPGTFAFGFVTTPSSLDVVSARFLGCSAGAPLSYTPPTLPTNSKVQHPGAPSFFHTENQQSSHYVTSLPTAS